MDSIRKIEEMVEELLSAERALAQAGFCYGDKYEELKAPVRRARAVLSEAVSEAAALAERLKMEAQIHAGEARSANATIAEIYQLCTGATGEPGNWHGAEPVRQTLASKEAELVRLREGLKDQIRAFDGDTIDEIEVEYGLSTAQRIDRGRRALTQPTE